MAIVLFTWDRNVQVRPPLKTEMAGLRLVLFGRTNQADSGHHELFAGPFGTLVR